MAREFDTVDRAHARWETRCDFFRTLSRVDKTALLSFEKLYKKANEMTGAEFKIAFDGWAQKRNIRVPWVMATLRETLVTWEHGLGLGEFVNPGNYSTPSNSLFQRMLFHQHIAASFEDFVGFEPTAETAEDFSKRLDARYDAFKHIYVVERRLEAEYKGYKHYTPRRQREAHLEWLIRYQVLGRDYNDIAGDYLQSTGRDRTPEAVREAIKDMAQFIGLILRE